MALSFRRADRIYTSTEEGGERLPGAESGKEVELFNP